MAKEKLTAQEMAEMTAAQLEKLLTPRERAFCEIYLEKRNGTAAALDAGYGNGNTASAAVIACRLLRRDKIAAYTAARGREIFNHLHITPETVAADINRTYRRAEKAEDYRAAAKLLELMGDSLGMFEKGQRISGGTDNTIKIELGAELEELAE